MNRYLMERIRRLSTIFVNPTEGMPPPDPDQIVAFSREFFFEGTPAFSILYLLAVIALQALCRILRRESIYSLSSEEAEEFLQSLANSRLSALGTLPTLLGMPFFLAHYNRDDVQKLLGFDLDPLREEAAKREVGR